MSSIIEGMRIDVAKRENTEKEIEKEQKIITSAESKKKDWEDRAERTYDDSLKEQYLHNAQSYESTIRSARAQIENLNKDLD